MGLTIHYSLSMPAKTGPEQTRGILESLHQRCLDLPFDHVTGLVALEGADCDWEGRGQDDPLRWFLIQSRAHLFWRFEGGKPVAARQGEDWKFVARPDPLRVIGFKIDVGEGCETANVGFATYPERIEVETPSGGKALLDLREAWGGWRWSSFCKTQYANDPESGGIRNFLRCHLSVVAMLDAAKELVGTVEVKDEGKYWEGRDVEALIRQVGEWDGLVAAFAGKLKDAAEGSGIAIVAPITGRKDFERLEAEGQGMLGADIDEKLMRLLRLTRKRSGKG